MYESCSVDRTLEELETTPQGLKDTEIDERRIEFGFNELQKKKRSKILLLLGQFHDTMVYILIAALLLSIIVPFYESAGVPHIKDFLDAIVIFAILVLNAVLGFVQEYRAEEAIASLEKLSSPHARVRRDGKERIIESRELLPGDIVIIEAGDKISADLRIIEASHLRMNESSLTGESHAIDKNTEALAEGKHSLAEQRCVVFAGTLVTRGSAECVVVAIAMQTEIGQIAKLVSQTKIPETPLQGRMKQLGKLLGTVVMVMCAGVLGIGMYKGMPFFEILLVGVSLAVSAVPEGLPAVVTVCLAMGVKRMIKKNALVRRLDSLEALGSVTVICADKTGTITQNRMKVVDTWLSGHGEPEDLLALIAASCNRAVLPNIGDPTEIGLLQYAEGRGLKRLPIDEEDVPFTSEDKYMKTRHGNRRFLKGAPEKIMMLCDGVNKEEVTKHNDAFAEQGLRVLACAIQEEGNDNPRLVGLVAMEDPPRETAARAIEEARTAGIHTIMITGDNPVTAKAIARKVGIEGDVMLGLDIDNLSDTELNKKLDTVGVFARVSPKHKLRILDVLKQQGEIVAMSGDGVNDAPALKSAHVGIAMGKVGTEVAREASSMVLTDDHFETIVAAIREGRRIYDNIKKFVIYLLRSNFDELLFISTALLLGMPLPYLPIHILWINLMTDGLPALALGMEKAEKDIMERPPRNPTEHILAGEGGRLVFAALLSFALAFLYYLWNLRNGVSLIQTRSATLTLAILFELFMAFSMRSRQPIWRIGLFSNRWLLIAVMIPFLLQLVLLYTPMNIIFHLEPISLTQWVQVFAIAFLGFLFFEVLKLRHPDVNVEHRWIKSTASA